MRILLRIFPLLLVTWGASLLFERPAFAYADPGTGLLAIQALGSALVATGWYLRRKVHVLFHRTEANPESEPSTASKQDEGVPLP